MKICLTCEGVTPDEGAAATCAHCGGPLLDTSTVHYPERRGDEDARSPLVGRVVDGKYRVVGVLGRGGMGVVYRAVHEVSLVHVALKVLHPRFAAREDFRAWFLGEARKAGRVIHENSARVMDVGVARDGMVYIAVEFVDGVTLQDWTGGRPVEPDRLLPLLEQVARALAAAHTAGVVHRDLSPRNVMVTARDGRPVAKILDFGIAVGPGPLDPDAVDGAPGGFANPPYSAPEHLAGETVDGRADLYSLGVIAYEALTGDLPVAGDTGRELARATLEGGIRPMRSGGGVPRVLARLVDRLLARDPADRPASAEEVAERLHRILHPRRVASTVGAIAALVAAAVGFALAHAPRGVGTPYLEVRPGALSLRSGPDAGEVQEVRRADLLAVRFEYSGFDPADLLAEVKSADGDAVRIELRPYLRVDEGSLRFGAGAAAFVDGLAARSRSAPVELRLYLAGRPPFGYARLRVDDEPPVVELATDATAGVLRGADGVTVHVSDAGEVVRRALFAEVGRGGESEVAALGGDVVAGAAAELLGDAFPGLRSIGPVRLRAMAVDRAGNVGWSPAVALSLVDLAVPQIRAVGSARGGMVLVDEPDGARLRVHLDGEEPGLAVLVRAPAAEVLAEVAGVQALGERLDVVLPPGAVSGRWAFAVRDPAGNVSRVFEEDLEVRGADPEVEIEPADAEARPVPRAVVRLGDLLVGSGEPFDLALRHNPIYQVDRIRIAAGDGEAPDAHVVVRAPQAGASTLAVGALPPGAYELRLRLVEPLEGRAIDVAPTRLQVLPAAVELRLPAVDGVRHLRELEERAVLRVADGALVQGGGWRLVPPDARLLRGRVWTGPTGAVAPLAIDAAGPDAPLLVGGALGRGWHVVAVDATDVLGRRVDVWLGDVPAPRIALPDGRDGHEIARFFHHDRPFAAIDSTTLVEFGQPVRLEISAVLPAGDVALVRARLAGAELAPVRVDHGAIASRLTFLLPFERVAVAADLEVLDARAFATGVDASLTLGLTSPAGEASLRIAVRTIRSTLREVTLGEVAQRALPGAIAGLRLVPIPGPEGPWRERTFGDADARRRARIGPGIEVRNVADIYLLDRELDRAAYREIVDAGLARLAELGAMAPRVVHPADPLGAARLTAAGLLPTAFRDQPERFAAAVRSAPERPVSGVDAVQAHAGVGLLGIVCGDDPELLRLPLGCELEIAAFGARPGSTLNGAALHDGGIDAVAARQLARRAGDLERWPPSAAELREVGDLVESELGAHLIGLDGGVREWVLDLPSLSGGAESRVLLEEWLGDHRRHVEQALGLFDGRAGERVPGELRAFAETYGVLRGAAAVPLDLDGVGADVVRADWPGVVRTLQIRRDGAGLVPGRVDPRLVACGFRIAGGARFVDEVRRRW